MAELKLYPLAEIFNKTQIRNLTQQLKELGINDIPDGEDADFDLDETLGDDQLTDFMDRLDAHDLACDVYLPVEFEGRIEIEEQAIGSAYALLDALEELRDELDIDEDEEEEEEEELDMEVIEEQLRHAWRTFLRGASTSIDRKVPLHVIS